MKKHVSLPALLICLAGFLIALAPVPARADSDLSFVVLSATSRTMNIGDEYQLIALTSTGKKPTFKSSSSKVASVNTYGKITAKKAGSCKITAKIKNAEATCKVTVRKTEIVLNQTALSLEHGETAVLTARTSNGSEVTWKSNKKSVATVDENGRVTAGKPGSATITAKADGTSVTCKVTVKKPTVKLNRTKLTLYRGQTSRLVATVSSGLTPTWKSSKRSVATVEDGLVTAVKHGSAVITAKIDGVSVTCKVTVRSPEISLNASSITLTEGETYRLKATVSSKQSVEWSSSNSQVATVSDSGLVKALKKGKTYIYASEDGTKERCIVRVLEKED